MIGWVRAMLREPGNSLLGRRADAPTVVQLAGELDFLSAPSTTRYLDALTAGPRPHHLVLDLGQLTFLDCTGVGVLCRARRRIRARGGRLSLVITDPRQRWILHAVGLGDAFEVLDAVPDGEQGGE